MELAEDVLELPVRLGTPHSVGGLHDVVKSPVYSTGVGLVLYGASSGYHFDMKFHEENVYSRVRTRMREWFAEVF